MMLEDNDSFINNSTSRGISAMHFDEISRKWVPVTHSSTSTSSSKEAEKPKEVPSTNPSSEGNAVSKVDSQGQADKEYREIEYNTLVGELKVKPNEKTLKVKVNQTIKIEGVGKYLSGLFYVTNIKRELSEGSGYSQIFSVIKTGFGVSLKSSQANEEVKEESRIEEIPKESIVEFNVGVKVKIVGEDAIYANAHDGVKVPEWVKQQTHTIDRISSDNTRVLLKEIWSWVYVKYIQKV